MFGLVLVLELGVKARVRVMVRVMVTDVYGYDMPGSQMNLMKYCLAYTC